jgi:hypothetical protein
MALAIDMRKATAAPALSTAATLSRGIRRILLASTVTLFALMLVIAYRMSLGVVTRVDT